MMNTSKPDLPEHSKAMSSSLFCVKGYDTRVKDWEYKRGSGICDPEGQADVRERVLK